MFKRRTRVSPERVRVSHEDGIARATASATPEHRRSLLNIQVVSRRDEETEAQWRDRVNESIHLAKPPEE